MENLDNKHTDRSPEEQASKMIDEAFNKVGNSIMAQQMVIETLKEYLEFDDLTAEEIQYWKETLDFVESY